MPNPVKLEPVTHLMLRYSLSVLTLKAGSAKLLQYCQCKAWYYSSVQSLILRACGLTVMTSRKRITVHSSLKF